jgi:hypothetical protein
MSNDSEKVLVLGVLVDSVWSCGKVVERGKTIHDIASSLWATLINQVNKDSTEIIDLPSATEIYLGEGEIDSSAAFTDLTLKLSQR